VFDEMRDAAEPFRFVPAADADPHAERDALHVGHGRSHDPDAVGQFSNAVHEE
jgi:hypothetical protein